MKNIQMACKLTSPELRKRKEEVIAILKQQLLERSELANGFRYKFNGDDAMLDNLVDFIKSERLCCPFFNFSMEVTNSNFAFLQITGDEGVKSFITGELEM